MGTKTSELIGPALDWATAKCENVDPQFERHSHGGVWPWWTIADPIYRRMPNYSTDWRQGGPIIDREKINLYYSSERKEWAAAYWEDEVGGGSSKGMVRHCPTALIAAMRCYVTSKLGDEIEIPKELL